MARTEDHTDEVKKKLEQNISRALKAMGLRAVGLVLDKMESGYMDEHRNRDAKGNPAPGTHTAIRDTGDLMRDVCYEVDRKNRQVRIGNNLKYALFVHEGTSKLAGRPYLMDAITEGKDELAQVAQRYLSEKL